MGFSTKKHKTSDHCQLTIGALTIYTKAVREHPYVTEILVEDSYAVRVRLIIERLTQRSFYTQKAVFTVQ